MAISRRSLIKRGIFGGVLLAGGGLASLGSRSSRLVVPLRELKHLSEAQYSVFSAIAARVIPEGNGFPSTRVVQVAEKVDEVLGKLHPTDRAELLQAISLLENSLAAFLLDARVTPFTRLDGEGQDRALRAWRDSRFLMRRSAYRAMKLMVTAAYYGSPESWEAVGYPGPPDVSGFRVSP